jgi:hypothetical protein
MSASSTPRRRTVLTLAVAAALMAPTGLAQAAPDTSTGSGLDLDAAPSRSSRS